MKLHELGPSPGQHKRRRRVARGNAGRAGYYAGRGRKGQNSRSGGGKKAYFEGGQLPFVRRLPYRRGFNNIFRVEYVPINIEQLDARFEAGSDVTPETLAEAGLLRTVHAGYEPYKILAGGSLTKALNISAPRVSEAASTAIVEAGGTIELLEDDHVRAGMRREHRRHR